MGLFSKGKKSSKRKLDRLVREERAKDARRAKYPKPVKHKRNTGWFF